MTPSPRTGARSRRPGDRGSIAALVAVMATALLGIASLAIDAGAWYLAFRKAASAADLAALSGANAIAQGGGQGGTQGAAVATDAARRNGFTTAGRSTVTVASPPAAGSYAGSAAAVEVSVTQTQALSVAGLLLASAPTVRARAVAAATFDSNVCLLGLGGGLVLEEGVTTGANRCSFAANAASPGGIQLNGSALMHGLYTTGDCDGCTTGDAWTDSGRTERPTVSASRPAPVADPYAGLQGWTPSPPACLSGGASFSGNALTLSPGQSICNTLSVNSNQTLTLNPGVYFFQNADLTVQGTIQGNGVTLVFTGNGNFANVGTLRIVNRAKGSLRGPTATLIPGHPEAAGLLVYRDARATNNGDSKQVQLDLGSATLFGGLYFPTSNVSLNGNTGAGASTCLEVVGYQVTAASQSDTRVDVAGCAGFTAYSTILKPRLVE